MSKQTICVVGNPNCGKTTLFNALTGAHQEVGNWPGVTVEKKVGHYSYNGEDIEIVDLPGIYSITPASTAGEDERVARDYILTNESSCVVNIVDASNLERNLYLTSQLIEMRVPMIVVVNMLDIAEAHHLKINLEALQEFLKCPVIGMVAARNKGVEELKGAISDFLKKPFVPPMTVKFDEKITHCAHAVEDQLAKLGVERPNWFAVQLMENAPGIADKLPAGAVDAVKPIVEPLNKEFDGDLDIAIADARYQFVAGIAEKAIKREGEVSATVTDKIDRVVLNRWLGLPIFLLVMYVMFLFTQNFGAAFIDFFDIFVGGVAVIAFSYLFGVGRYNGAGMGVITAAVEQGEALPWDFLCKIFLTALTLSCGFKGGEVVPSFFVGATFGCVFGPLLGLPAGFAAAVGLVSIFCGATNALIPSILMGFELFSGAGLELIALGCGICYMLSGHHGLYSSQTFVTNKLRSEYMSHKLRHKVKNQEE